MRAVLFGDSGLSMIKKPIPKINQREVLVKVKMVGICNTDIELIKGYYGFKGVAGHEFVGIIEQSPQKPEIIGKRIVGDINRGCGACVWCMRGDGRHCPARQIVGIAGWDGAFAEYMKLPLINVRIVDDNIPDECAVFSEPLAAALEISQQIHITNNQRVIVLGDGKLGLLIALGLRHFNHRLILVGKHKEKLRIAAEHNIGTICIGTPYDFENIARKEGLFDIVIEATGKAEGINDALKIVRPEGIIVAKTTSRDFSKIDMAKAVVDEISIIGSRCGDIDLALSFLRNKLVDPMPLIDSIYPFEKFSEAFERAVTPGAKKVLVRF
ncbi:MAG TPA: alcohol dehydrogenase catalytic domain-containing protein [Candidatus Sumerlaeota bacterium]|nr:alcohol dehydrogenase catalytic domain-containing protein [Candidatus Sumerlaeota bacterium]